MQAHIYPTPPSQLSPTSDHDPPSQIDGDQASDSPGTAKYVLGKVKNKARKLRDKIKAVTSTNKDDKPESQPDVGEEEETSDEVDVGDQPQYQQLQSIGALGGQHGDGSESEVPRGTTDPRSKPQGGPAFDQDARNLDEVNTGTPDYGTDERMNDATPSNEYKSTGPPDVLQAVPTEYRSYAPDVATEDRYKSNASLTDETPGVEGCPRDMAMDDVENKGSAPQYAQDHGSAPPYPQEDAKGENLEQDSAGLCGAADEVDASDIQATPRNPEPDCAEEYAEDDPKGKNLEPDSLGLPVAAEGVDRSDASDIEASPRNPAALNAGVNEVFPDDLAKPNPAFGNNSPTSDKIGVLNLQMSEPCSDKQDNIVDMPVPECEESLSSLASAPVNGTPTKEYDGLREDFPLPEEEDETPVNTLQDETPFSTLQAAGARDQTSYDNKYTSSNARSVDEDPTHVDVSAADNVEEMDRKMSPEQPEEKAVASDFGNLNLDSKKSADAGKDYYDPDPMEPETQQAVNEDEPQPDSLTEYATGSLQGLTNTVASKIGYGSSQSSDQGNTATAAEGKVGYDSWESPDKASAATKGEEAARAVEREPSKEVDEQSVYAAGGMQGPKEDTLESKLGYGNSETLKEVEQARDEGARSLENDPKVSDSNENDREGGDSLYTGDESSNNNMCFTQEDSNNMSSTQEDGSSPSTTTGGGAATGHAKEAVDQPPPASPGILGRVSNALSSYLGIQHPAASPPQHHHDPPAAAAPDLPSH